MTRTLKCTMTCSVTVLKRHMTKVWQSWIYYLTSLNCLVVATWLNFQTLDWIAHTHWYLNSSILGTSPRYDLLLTHQESKKLSSRLNYCCALSAELLKKTHTLRCSTAKQDIQHSSQRKIHRLPFVPLNSGTEWNIRKVYSDASFLPGPSLSVRVTRQHWHQHPTFLTGNWSK